MNKFSDATKDNADSQLLISSLTENNSQDNKSASKKTKVKGKHTSKFNTAHMIIPLEDMDWVFEQSPTVYRLWGECWRCDPYGSRMMPLTTSLKGDNLRKAKKVLKESGLFEFEIRMKVINGKPLYETYVLNYHGSRSSYWILKSQTVEEATQINSTPPQTNKPTPRTDNPGGEAETNTQQTFQKPSVSSQERLSNSSEELLRRDNLPTKPKTPDKPTSLMSHLEAADMGIMPSLEVIDQLKDSSYWTGFVYAAKKHGWDLSQWCSQTLSPEMKEKRATQLKELKEKAKNKKF